MGAALWGVLGSYTFGLALGLGSVPVPKMDGKEEWFFSDPVGRCSPLVSGLLTLEAVLLASVLPVSPSPAGCACVPGAAHLLSGPLGEHRLIRAQLRDWAEAAIPSCYSSWQWWYCWDPGAFWSSIVSCHWPEEDKWVQRFPFLFSSFSAQ